MSVVEASVCSQIGADVYYITANLQCDPMSSYTAVKGLSNNGGVMVAITKVGFANCCIVLYCKCPFLGWSTWQMLTGVCVSLNSN